MWFDSLSSNVKKSPQKGTISLRNVFTPFSLTSGAQYPATCSLDSSVKLLLFFFFISMNICFGCSKITSQYGSFEYPQHIFLSILLRSFLEPFVLIVYLNFISDFCDLIFID